MFYKNFIIIFLLLTSLIYCQNYHLKIYLKDGATVEGKLLKISGDGVEINQGGNVASRYISAKLIKNVEIVELKKTIDFTSTPIVFPEEISNNVSSISLPATRKSPAFLSMATIGYANMLGTYYEGFSSGITMRLRGFFGLNNSDPNAGRFMLGFTYGYSSIAGGKIYGRDMSLSLNEYSFECMRTFSPFSGGQYFYGLAGLVIMAHKVSASPLNGLATSSDEQKVGLRLEVGFVFPFNNWLGGVVSFSLQPVLAEQKTNNTIYNYSNNNTIGPTFAIVGGIINFNIGITCCF